MTTRPFAIRFCVIALCCIGFACVVSWLAPFGWPFELFSHFRLQLLIAAALICIALLLLRQPALAVIAALLTIPSLVPFVSMTAPVANAGTQCRSAMPFRLVTANVEFINDDHARFLRWLEDNPADFVIVQEVTGAWAQALRSTAAAYPYSKFAPREDPYGLALLSRWPLQAESVDLAGDGLPSFMTTVAFADGPVHVLATHTRWPVTPVSMEYRETALRQAAALMRRFSSRAVMAGDLNLTPYAPSFSRLLRDGNLTDAQAERIWRPTWEAGFWPLALPIDHVLVTQGTCVLGTQVGPDVGSDHRPLRAALGWPG